MTLATMQRPRFQLSRGGYAKDDDGKPCGVHSITATQFDLAGLLWLDCEQYDGERREQAFAECWSELRKHIAWNKRQTPTNESLCKFLDQHSLEWHVMVVEQMVNGVEYNPAQKQLAKHLTEYV